MYRIVKLGSKPYALEISDVEDDLENIQTFVDEATVVILADDLEDAQQYFDEEIEVVDPE